MMGSPQGEKEMARYFFDVVDGTRIAKDDQGLQMVDLQGARAAAMNTVGQITREILPDGSRRHVVVKVRDEEGSYVYECTVDSQGADCRAFDDESVP